MNLLSEEKFEFSGRIKTLSTVALSLGLLFIAIGAVTGQGARVWANLLLCSYYFTCMSFAGVMFIAIQYVADAGWATAILRIPQAFSALTPITGGILILLAGVGLFSHQLYHHWNNPGLTDPSSEIYDALIAGKSSYLNSEFFIIRMILYIVIWSFLGYKLRMLANIEDNALKIFKKSRTISAIFCVVFGFTFPLFAFDIMMSIEAHWFSTMFGWYNLAGLWVTGLAAITLTAIILKEKGYLSFINHNHFHDLGKLIFGFTIFWTYTWLGQFLLIWYANIPEETVYFANRWTPEYKLWFWMNIAINFVIPFFTLLINYIKRNIKPLKIVCIIVICGHWLDYYLMVMPGSVGSSRGFGFPEIGAFLTFAGLFAYLTFYKLSKQSLLVKNHPYMEESLHHHVNNI